MEVARGFDCTHCKKSIAQDARLIFQSLYICIGIITMKNKIFHSQERNKNYALL
jgi:phosphopantetheine adenylyltransferase